MMNIARLWPPYRRLYRARLAQGTPLIDGRETKILARAMGYDADLLRHVVEDKPLEFEPRESYPSRLQEYLGRRKGLAA